MLVVGENEEQNGTISVRRRGEGDLGAMKLEDFVTYFKEAAKIWEIWDLIIEEFCFNLKFKIYNLKFLKRINFKIIQL